MLGFGIIRSAGKKAEYVDMGVLDIRKEKEAIHLDATDALAALFVAGTLFAQNYKILLKLEDATNGEPVGV